MADLTFKEKRFLEKLFDMGEGYVLDFSNRTFSDFITDTVNINIYSEKYGSNGNSKANRLRTFWKEESNRLVGELTEQMLEYMNNQIILGELSESKFRAELSEECKKIYTRLKHDSIVENADILKPNNNEKDFSLLSRSIRQNLENNEPELGLDRLHTFMTKYVRGVCDKRGIEYERKIPLNGLFGKYVKYLKDSGLIESEMSIEILKSAIKVLERFNLVRNEQSFAHDNKLLNYEESILIFNNIANVIKYVESIEQCNVSEKENSDDLHF